MPQYFHRPENALKRANEFIDVEKKHEALGVLIDIIKSRKHRTWQKIHEPIMYKFVELCVELKKSNEAKEGLFQYRNICQQVNIKSLEDVVRSYLRLADEKTESAREESQQAVDIDDLDQVQTPENLLLSAVSKEGAQDRTDRIVLIPWVKFLWESYRQCLELLRNNSRIERLYHDIAQQAFKFCLKYNRKTEFRKLCDNLRAHLGIINRFQNQQTSVNLNNPESRAMHLETRLVQLDNAIQMELWQEAYKAIEDIHDFMNFQKKSPNPRLMANYYQKLSLVFWKSNNYEFHAATLFRLFCLSREQKKNITTDEVLKMAAHVLLATLAIPLPPNNPGIDRLVETDDRTIDKNRKLLSSLLGLSHLPSRAILIKDLVRFGILQHAPVQLQDLYRWLEIEFDPLKLSSHVQQSFDFLNSQDDFVDLRQYIPRIQGLAIIRIVEEISQVYETITFSKLLGLIPFVQSLDLEYIIVEVCRRNSLQIRIDHTKKCLYFGSNLNVSQRAEIADGPFLQNMPSDQMRSHLINIYSVLKKSVRYIQPSNLKKNDKLVQEMLKACRLASSKDRIHILSRQQIIEERKEKLETLTSQKVAEERKLLEDKQQKLLEAEKERMARETEERTKQRLLREQTEMKRKVVMEKIEQLKKTEIGSRIFVGMDEEELEKLDPDDLLNKQVEQLDKERKEQQAKLRQQERKLNHTERAKRIEEIPILQAKYEEQKVKDLEVWQDHEQERIKVILEERALAVQHKDRLMRLKNDKDKFLEQLKKARYAVYQEKLLEFNKVLAEEREKVLAERKQKRIEERRAEWLRKQEENRQRLIEEQIKREQEEKLREEKEKLARLEEIEAKKRAKEKEIEERLKREQENVAALEKKQSEIKGVGLIKGKESDKVLPPKSTNWREKEQGNLQRWAPQNISKDDEDQNDKHQGWRKRSDEPKNLGERDQNRMDDWRKGDKEEKNNWRRDDNRSSSYQRSNYDDRSWRSQRSDDRNGDRDRSGWRSAANRGRDEPKKISDRDRTESFPSKDRMSSHGKEYGSSDKGHSLDGREKYGKDRANGSDRSVGIRGDRSIRSNRETDDRRENRSWNKRDDVPNTGSSWRDKNSHSDRDDNRERRGLRGDGFKKDRSSQPDEDGFVRVRR